MNEIDPTSGFDLNYKALSEEDRGKLTQDIESILAESVKGPLETLKASVRSAVDTLYDTIIVNPWPELLRSESSNCDIFTALAEEIWQSMLKMRPSKLGEWKMRELFKSWMKNYPDDLAEVCNTELLRENKKLKEDLDFARRAASSTRGMF